MSNAEQLKEIFTSHPECIKNHKLFNALLLDYFYEDKVVQNIYRFLSIEGILADIFNKSEVNNVDVERYCLIILNSYGIDKNRVRPCVLDLTKALDKSSRVPDKKVDSNVKKSAQRMLQPKDKNTDKDILTTCSSGDVYEGEYLGVSSDTKLGLIQCEDNYFYVLPSNRNKKVQLKCGEMLYFISESIGAFKFATVISKEKSKLNTGDYPVLNRKWEGVIQRYDSNSLIGVVRCEHLEDDFEMLINAKVIKQNIQAGDIVTFNINVNGNKLLATDIEKRKK